MYLRIYSLMAVVLLVSLAERQVNAQSAIPTVTWQKLLDGNVSGVSISPDGNHVIYSDLKVTQLTVLERQTGNIIWKVDNAPSTQSEWSPDGKYIATRARDIQIYDAVNGKHIEHIERTLKDTEITLRLVTGSEERRYTDIKWSADSRQLAAMTYGYVIIYDFAAKMVMDIIDLTSVTSGDLHDYLSFFDWSPDESKFAAFHFKVDEATNQAVFPLEIVMGFWNQNGRWLSEYEQSHASVSGTGCVPNGEIQTPLILPGSDIVWAPDNQTVAVSVGAIMVCSLQKDGKLLVHEVFSEYSNHLHWSPDQKWLFAILGNCTLLVSDVANDYANHLQPFDTENCFVNSAGWSSDSRYLAIGNSSGLWLGTVELPT